MGLRGHESPSDIEANTEVKRRIEDIRLAVGPLMNLGDVTDKTVPKMTLVSAPQHGGAVDTRTLIPHRVHDAIGVFGAVSVATACLVPGSVASEVAKINDPAEIEIEHPTGFFTVSMDVEIVNGAVAVKRAALLRTARLLMRGDVFVPRSVWAGP